MAGIKKKKTEKPQKTHIRKAGVLMNISSLPGPFGIGVFGEEAFYFVDKLAEMKFGFWQILPLGNLDYGNSPYASDSAFAGNYRYIDPRQLFEEGLLSEEELEECKYQGSPYTVDYGFVYESRGIMLKKAFANYKALSEEDAKPIAAEIRAFVRKNGWIKKYAEFTAHKNLCGMVSWWEWSSMPKPGKDELKYEAEFVTFVQYLFFKQWDKVKKYANSKGIKIIGDMPVYVAMDSCDVWANPELFQLDEDGIKPLQVAGVPPDYFSEDGQLWGNPLYDWKKMKETGYKWWGDRLEAALKMYDVLRIDHFRGLASYWAVPAGDKTARGGHWEEGPGQDLFDAVKDRYKNGEILAEDLGVYGQDVVDLLNSTGFAQMRVIQFAFDETRDSVHLPQNYPVNSIAYVGTHDNNTMLGWLYDATPEERDFALKYCGFRDGNWGEGGYYSKSCRAFIEAVWKSPARYAVVAVQDMCGFGSDTRMNMPGVEELNWRYRATKETLDSIDTAYFAEINDIFGRICD